MFYVKNKKVDLAMNMKEWEEKEIQRTHDSEEARIFLKFTRNEIPMTATEKELLESYIEEGGQRQKAVAERARAVTGMKETRLLDVAGHLMYMEPYVVFYQRCIVNEETNFESIEYWVEKVQQWLIDVPSYQEQVLYAERMY
jgi:hypothetical protein